MGPPVTATIGGGGTTLLSRAVELDAAASLRIHGFFEPVVPRWVLRGLELSGDGRFWLPVPVSLLLLASGPTGRLLPLALLAGSLLDLALVGLLKHLVRRPRPVYNKGMSVVVALDHWSFPSGHSSRVFFVSSFLSLSLSLDQQSAGLVPLVGAWSAATSASRVLLGRHFVGDVVAGALLGVLEGLLVFHCFRLWWTAGLEA